jgi:hypothetical protein
MIILLAFLISSAAADCSAVSNGTAVTVGDCTKYPAVQQWVFPAAGTAGKITLKADSSYCLDFHCTQNPCFSSGRYGPDAFATKCTGTTPTFTVNPNKTVTVAEASGKIGKGMCVDLRGNVVVQVYPCVGSKNQQWTISNSELVSDVKTCASACTTPAPTPAPPSGFCARYHPIHDSNVYDPSGPLLDDSGLWHQWEDDGAWSHWTSTDLIHWNGSFHDSTNFGGDTGSVSPTKSGVYAFWPIMSGESKGAIGSAVATDAALTKWTHRGATIPMPSRINTGYRDPVRAFEWDDKWYVGVGCGNKAEGAQFCLFQAEDDTLAEFTDQGSLYTTNVTFGEVDGNIVWQVRRGQWWGFLAVPIASSFICSVSHELHRGARTPPIIWI